MPSGCNYASINAGNNKPFYFALETFDVGINLSQGILYIQFRLG